MERLPSAFTIHDGFAWLPTRTDRGWVWLQKMKVIDYGILTSHGMIYGRKYQKV